MTINRLALIKGIGILALGILGLSVFSCRNSVSTETIQYLKKVQLWQDKWNEQRWQPVSPSNISNWLKWQSDLEQLASELAAIISPNETLQYPTIRGGEDFYIPRKHSEYVNSVNAYLSAQRNEESVLALLKTHWQEMVKDPFWRAQYPDWIDYYISNPSYRDSQQLSQDASYRLGQIETEYMIVFQKYIP